MSIWTDLLFLHGYIVNPATLTETADAGRQGAVRGSPRGDTRRGSPAGVEGSRGSTTRAPATGS